MNGNITKINTASNYSTQYKHTTIEVSEQSVTITENYQI